MDLDFGQTADHDSLALTSSIVLIRSTVQVFVWLEFRREHDQESVLGIVIKALPGIIRDEFVDELAPDMPFSSWKSFSCLASRCGFRTFDLWVMSSLGAGK